MTKLGISDTAVLIGFDATGACVYSAAIPLGEYWDTDHVWDDGDEIAALRMRSVRGYLFDSSGQMIQQFESTYAQDGSLLTSLARHADGTRTQFPPQPQTA